MNLIQLIIRKFEKEPTVIDGAIETWCVEWRSICHDIGTYYKAKVRHQAFTTQESADSYAKELEDARRLLGDGDTWVKVYKQEAPTNL